MIWILHSSFTLVYHVFHHMLPSFTMLFIICFPTLPYFIISYRVCLPCFTMFYHVLPCVFFYHVLPCFQWHETSPLAADLDPTWPLLAAVCRAVQPRQSLATTKLSIPDRKGVVIGKYLSLIGIIMGYTMVKIGIINQY